MPTVTRWAADPESTFAGYTPPARHAARKPPPPDGWYLIAPIDAVPGDGALLPDGTVLVLGERLFDPLPLYFRRRSWAVRRTPRKPSWPARLRAWWRKVRHG